MTDTDGTLKSDPQRLFGEESEVECETTLNFRTNDESTLPESAAHLDLLLPDSLPAELPLTAEDRSEMRNLLMNLLNALQTANHDDSLRRIDELLHNLRNADTQSASVEDTSIPAKAEQVEDFDRYFRINRIHSNKPALSLVRGLLQTSHAVMSLLNQADHLSQRQVQDQIAGFIAYTHLLARTFELGELS